MRTKGAAVLVHDMKKQEELKEDTLSPLEGLEIQYLLGKRRGKRFCGGWTVWF
ncbi:MAG: hypothetical protein ACLR23_23680 [Clostridia bacterium]